MTPIEKDVEKALGRMIGRFGGRCLKWVCPGWAGVPDRICLLPGGRVYFIELKRPVGATVAARQKAWRRILQDLGFDARVINCTADIKKLEIDIKGAAADDAGID